MTPDERHYWELATSINFYPTPGQLRAIMFGASCLYRAQWGSVAGPPGDGQAGAPRRALAVADAIRIRAVRETRDKVLRGRDRKPKSPRAKPPPRGRAA